MIETSVVKELIAKLYATGKARIRVQLSAAHSTDDVNRCINAFTEVGKQLKVID